MTETRRRIPVIFVLMLLVAAAFWMTRFIGVHDDVVNHVRGSASETIGTDPANPNSTDARRKTSMDRPSTDSGAGGVRGVLREKGTERPLEGIDLTLRLGDEATPRLTSKTAADGSFRFDEVAPQENWRIASPSKTGLEGLDSGGIAVSADEVTDLGILYLTRSFVVEGDVVDAAGRPVAGAEVRILRPGSRGLVPSEIFVRMARAASRSEPRDDALTDERGTFRLTRLDAGTHDVEVMARGFASYHEEGVSIPPRDAGMRLRFVVRAGTTLSGRVVRHDGGPVIGARLAAWRAGREDQGANAGLEKAHAETGVDGAFGFVGLGSGVMVVAVEIDGEPIRLRRNVVVPSDDPLEIVVDGKCRLEGRVTDRDGLPVKDATITLLLQDLDSFIVSASTDEDGRYVISGLEPGPIRDLLVRARGHALWPHGSSQSVRRAERLKEITEGTQRQDVVMERGASVAGRVVEAGTGRPLEGARVSVLASGAAMTGDFGVPTDAEGRFELHGLGKMDGVLRASKVGWVQVGDLEFVEMLLGSMAAIHRAAEKNPRLHVKIEDDLALDSGDRTIEMAPAPMLEGRVVDVEGRGVAGALVVREAIGGDMKFLGAIQLSRDTCDENGRFRLPMEISLRSAAVIRASSRGFATTILEDVRIRPSTEDAGEFQIRLDRGATVEGVVVDEADRPVAGADVHLTILPESRIQRFAGGGRPLHQTTGADGRFGIASISVAGAEISALHPDHLHGSPLKIELAEGATTDVRIVVEGGRSIRGRLSNAEGEPVADWFISVKPIDPTMKFEERWARYVETKWPMTTTNRDGSFAVRGLPAGQYEV